MGQEGLGWAVGHGAMVHRRSVASVRAGRVATFRRHRCRYDQRRTMDGPTLLLAIVVAAFGYACGSVPVGVLVARAIGGPDPRTIGLGADRARRTRCGRSGRAGRRSSSSATCSRGCCRCWSLASLSGGDAPIEVVAATAALIGSARSMFLAFGGGRGVVTLAGTMLVILPMAVARRGPVVRVIVLLRQPVHVARVAARAPRRVLPTTLAIAALAPGGLPVGVPRLRVRRAGDRLDRPRRQHRPPDPRHGAPLRLRAAPRERPAKADSAAVDRVLATRRGTPWRPRSWIAAWRASRSGHSASSCR